MTTKITARDEPLICEWLNCQTASVDAAGDVWVEGPMTGHWLRDELDDYVTWRDAQLNTPTHWPQNDMLRRAGELLYGSRWQSDLARAIGVGDRRVREWAAGERRTPPGVWTDIILLLQARQSALSVLLDDLGDLGGHSSRGDIRRTVVD